MPKTTRNSRRVVVLLIVVVVVCFVAFRPQKSDHSRGEIPAYPVIDLRSGHRRDLGEYASRSHATVLWFWTPGCVACADEIDVVRESAENTSNVIAVGSFATNADARRYFENRNTGSIAVVTTEDDRLIDFFVIENLPTLIVFDTKGRETARFEGPTETTAIRNAITSALHQ